MIPGAVNADREPVIRFRIRDSNGAEHELSGIVDTGYTGWLTLPMNVIAGLGLAWNDLGAAVLADGSTIVFDTFEADVIWDGQVLSISVDQSESDPLIGMALMHGFRILIEDVDGGRVQLERMAPTQ